MREQLKRLEELQRYDAQIQDLGSMIKGIPAKLEASRSDLARIEAMLETERAQLGETQRYYNEQQAQLQTEETTVSGAKHKLSLAKNSREYVAAQREIEQTRESVQAREAEISKLVEAMQNKEKLMAERAEELKVLRAAIAKDGEIARAKMSELQLRSDALKAERDKVAAGIRPDYIKRYSTIRMRRGIAVATVRNGTCLGCNMNVPPQLFNTLQKGNSLETCPYCHRIVYWEDLMKEEAASPPVAGTRPKSAPSTTG